MITIPYLKFGLYTDIMRLYPTKISLIIPDKPGHLWQTISPLHRSGWRAGLRPGAHSEAVGAEQEANYWLAERWTLSGGLILG